jgi:AcrR family transcriptional regulator
MEDIGHEAGLSPTVAYRYFESKDDIIVATVEHSVDRAGRVNDAVQDGEDIRMVFEQMIDDFYLRLEQPGRDSYYRVRVQLWAETLQNARVAERAGLRRIDALMKHAALIEKGQDRGEINQDVDARTLAVALMASYDGFILHWLADPDIDIDQYREAHKAMVRGLLTINHK